MYNQKFVASLKANGKILREFNDTVRVPFGTEFSILLKNLNSVRAQVSVSIDGTPVTNNCKLVIQPNEEFELTRYINNMNLTSGNRFKFIERTENIEKHRGIKLEDGIVKIEYQFERKPIPSIVDQSVWPPSIHRGPYWAHDTGSVSYGANITTAGVSNTTHSTLRSSLNANVSTTTASLMEQTNDAGITVPGSISNQEFQSVGDFSVEFETHIIILKMLGEVCGGQQITQPITVKTKNTCQTCGRVNSYKAKFCSECATALVLV